jgi:hypothetical protein
MFREEFEGVLKDLWGRWLSVVFGVAKYEKERREKYLQRSWNEEILEDAIVTQNFALLNNECNRKRSPYP